MTRLGVGAVPSRNKLIHDNSGGGRGVMVAHEQATLLPVNLDVGELPVTVVGGGGAALRRVAALHQAGAEVTVVAAHVVPAIEDLADRGQLQWVRRGLRAGGPGPGCLGVGAPRPPPPGAAGAAPARAGG